MLKEFYLLEENILYKVQEFTVVKIHITMGHSKILITIKPHPCRKNKTGQIIIFHQKIGSQILTSLSYILVLVHHF